MILLTHCRAASHALLFRGRYAECHTAEVVSRDVGTLLTVPLPAVANSFVSQNSGDTLLNVSGMNGLRLFKRHCIETFVALTGDDLKAVPSLLLQYSQISITHWAGRMNLL
jgi:hypothetical protein